MTLAADLGQMQVSRVAMHWSWGAPGIFGKIYCQAAKASGAVAVDLGSAFDVLAGISTRPSHHDYDLEAQRWI
jgi:hypothetical protein